MVQVKFTRFGANSAFGGFAPGDMLRTSEAMARHLVEEVGVAEYAKVSPLAPTPEPTPEPTPQPTPAPVRASRKAK